MRTRRDAEKIARVVETRAKPGANDGSSECQHTHERVPFYIFNMRASNFVGVLTKKMRILGALLFQCTFG